MAKDIEMFATHRSLMQGHFVKAAEKVVVKVKPKNANKEKIRLDHKTEILVDADKLKRKGIDYFKKLYNK